MTKQAIGGFNLGALFTTIKNFANGNIIYFINNWHSHNPCWSNWNW